MNEDKKTCQIVQDLLPLYHDEVCSEESRKMVEEHLVSCDDCRKMAEKLNDVETEVQLTKEAESVLTKHAKKETRKSALVGGIVAGVLMLPVVVCLIVNLATGHGLSWFFIVLASLLVTASVTVTPLVITGKERKFLYTLGFFIATFLLLLMVLVIYVHGNWFFITAVPSILGISIVCAPIAAACIFKRGAISRCKGLLCMAWDTLWTYAVIYVCGEYVNASSEYWRISLRITTLGIILAWIIFFFFRYVKFHKLQLPGIFKAGIAIIVIGFLSIAVHDTVNFIIFGIWESVYTYFNFAVWNELTVNGNIFMIILFLAVVTGLSLMIIGCKHKTEE